MARPCWRARPGALRSLIRAPSGRSFRRQLRRRNPQRQGNFTKPRFDDSTVARPHTDKRLLGRGQSLKRAVDKHIADPFVAGPDLKRAVWSWRAEHRDDSLLKNAIESPSGNSQLAR